MTLKGNLTWEAGGLGSNSFWPSLAGKPLSLTGPQSVHLDKQDKNACLASFWIMVEGQWGGLDFGIKQTWFLQPP